MTDHQSHFGRHYIARLLWVASLVFMDPVCGGLSIFDRPPGQYPEDGRGHGVSVCRARNRFGDSHDVANFWDLAGDDPQDRTFHSGGMSFVTLFEYPGYRSTVGLAFDFSNYALRVDWLVHGPFRATIAHRSIRELEGRSVPFPLTQTTRKYDHVA